MRTLSREECQLACRRRAELVDYSRVLLQEGLGGCPWRVAVASILLCRTGGMRVRPVARALFNAYPFPADLARADTDELEEIVRPCGLHRHKARQLVRFSSAFLGDHWSHLRELPGVGAYVADAVGLCCFGCTDLDSGDHALVAYRDRLCNSATS